MERVVGRSVTTEGMRTILALGNRPGDNWKTWAESTQRDLDGEAVAFLSLMTLLAAQNAVAHAPEDRSKLNRNRVRRGELPLRDHVVVRMRLSAAERRSSSGSAGTGSGDPRRAHLVRGHFVNRAGKIFWRRSHARGFGSVPTKTVLVSP